MTSPLDDITIELQDQTQRGGKMKKLSLLILFVTVAALMLSACAPAQAPTPATVKETVLVPVVVTAPPAQAAAPKTGGTLIAARASDAKGLDPHKQTAFSSFRMLELIYDTLLTFDKDLKVVPNLAESWQWSGDGMKLTMALRKNVKFHNGDPMTSDDVKF